MGLAGDWSVEVNQASPITTSSPEILTRNGLVPPFQCHHSSSPRRGVSLPNTTPQQQQQQKTRTTTRFPLLFLPIKAKKKRKKREREIRKPTKPNQPNPPPKNKTQIQFRKKLSKYSTPQTTLKAQPSLGCGEDGSSFCGECHVGGRGEYVLTAVSSSASSNVLQFCLILRFSSAAPPRE